MNWAAFKTSVLALLGEDTDDENPVKIRQIDQALRSGCLRMQKVINPYQIGHEETYAVADLTLDCYAHRGEIPDGADIREFWRYADVDEEEDESECDRDRIRLHQIDWTERMSIITGTIRERNVWTVDPRSNRFYTPKLETGEDLHLFWDGLKIDFAEDDTLPWGEEAAEAVSHFVNAQLARNSKDKMNNHQSYTDDWRTSIALLEATEKERKSTSG